MRENRLVLPIPPGTHWKDVMPVVLPGGRKQIEDAAPRKRSGAPAVSELPKPQEKQKRGIVRLAGVSFAPPPMPAVEKPKRGKKQAGEAKPHVKNDPKHVAAARELRDRYLEQFNAQMAGGVPGGKYDVARALAAPRQSQRLQLPAAP